MSMCCFAFLKCFFDNVGLWFAFCYSWLRAIIQIYLNFLPLHGRIPFPTLWKSKRFIYFFVPLSSTNHIIRRCYQYHLVFSPFRIPRPQEATGLTGTHRSKTTSENLRRTQLFRNFCRSVSAWHQENKKNKGIGCRPCNKWETTISAGLL